MSDNAMNNEKIVEANNAFYRAFNERDIGAMSLAWSSDPFTTCIHPHSNVLKKREEVFESWRAILENPSQIKIISAIEHIHQYENMAVTVGRELAAGVPIAVTNSFIREDGQWKMLHHHASRVAER